MSPPAPLSQSELVKELSLVLTGAPSTHFPLDEARACFAIPAPAALGTADLPSVTLLPLLRAVLALATCCHRLSWLCDQLRKHRRSPVTEGLVSGLLSYVQYFRGIVMAMPASTKSMQAGSASAAVSLTQLWAGLQPFLAVLADVGLACRVFSRAAWEAEGAPPGDRQRLLLSRYPWLIHVPGCDLPPTVAVPADDAAEPQPEELLTWGDLPCGCGVRKEGPWRWPWLPVSADGQLGCPCELPAAAGPLLRCLFEHCRPCSLLGRPLFSTQRHIPTTAVMQFLFQAALQPFLDLLSMWIFRAVLQDPSHDFFIEERPGLPLDTDTEGDTFWQERFVVVPSRVPAFLAPVVDQVLCLGKTLAVVHFIAGPRFMLLVDRLPATEAISPEPGSQASVAPVQPVLGSDISYPPLRSSPALAPLFLSLPHRRPDPQCMDLGSGPLACPALRLAFTTTAVAELVAQQTARLAALGRLYDEHTAPDAAEPEAAAPALVTLPARRPSFDVRRLTTERKAQLLRERKAEVAERERQRVEERRREKEEEARLARVDAELRARLVARARTQLLLEHARRVLPVQRELLRAEWKLRRQQLAPLRLQFFSEDQQFGVLDASYVTQHRSQHSNVMAELMNRMRSTRDTSMLSSTVFSPARASGPSPQPTPGPTTTAGGGAGPPQPRHPAQSHHTQTFSIFDQQSHLIRPDAPPAAAPSPTSPSPSLMDVDVDVVRAVRILPLDLNPGITPADRALAPAKVATADLSDAPQPPADPSDAVPMALDTSLASSQSTSPTTPFSSSTSTRGGGSPTTEQSPTKPSPSMPATSPKPPRPPIPHPLPLPIAVRQCLLDPICQHSVIVNRAAIRLFLTKLRLRQHLHTIRCYYCFKSGFVMEELTRQWFDGLTAGQSWDDAAALSRTWWAAQQSALADAHSLTGLEDHVGLEVRPVRERPQPHHVTALDHVAMTYRVDFPLNVVITAAHLQQYGQIFRLLVKLKRAEHTLRSMFLRLDRGQGRGLMHSFAVFRFKLQSFVRIVQAYILHDGLQSEPTEFERRLAEGAFRDLDDLRASHSAMLLGVLDRCLLRPTQKPILTVVDAILALVLKLGLHLQTLAACQAELDVCRERTRLQMDEADGLEEEEEDAMQTDSEGDRDRTAVGKLEAKVVEVLREALAHQSLFQQYLKFLFQVLHDIEAKGQHDYLMPLLQQLQPLLSDRLP